MSALIALRKEPLHVIIRRAVRSCVVEVSATHRKHQARDFSGFLEDLAFLPVLPEVIVRNHKDIDGLISGLIANLESLRKRHKDYIEKHRHLRFKWISLRQRLLQGEQL